MKYFVRHFADGYQVFEKTDGQEVLIASFHRAPDTPVGEKSLAQQRAEEYCDRLNQTSDDDELSFDLGEDES
jgi:hypothetical protein